MLIQQQKAKKQVIKTDMVDQLSPNERSSSSMYEKQQIYLEQPNIIQPEQSSQSNKKLYMICLAVRLFIALFFTNTYHKPDQFFQGPQVAHHLVFGKGELAWEWTFKDPIRNPLFPIFYAFGYFILKITGLHNILPLFSKFPFIQQAFVAALFDILFIKINKHYNPKSSTKLLLLLNWGTWVTFFYPSRIYVNIVQAVLMMASFYLWIKRNQQQKYDLYSRILVGVNFAVRGTSIIFWVITWIYQLFMYHLSSIKQMSKFIIKNLLTIIFMVTFSIIISCIYYQKFVWVDYNFFYYNVIKGWSRVAGQSPFSQYFIKYHIKALSLLIIFQIWGIIKTFKSDKNNKQLKQLLFICTLAITILSLNGHKELRFMFVYLPYIFVFIVKGFLQFPKKLTAIKIIILGICIISSFQVVVKYSFIVHSTVIKTADYIRDTPSITNIYSFMGSFSVPLYSHIHRQGVILNQIQNPYNQAFDGKSQQNQFFQQTQNFVNRKLLQMPNLTHVMLNADRKQSAKLQKHGYQIQKQFQNTQIIGFPHVEYKIILWRKVNATTVLN